MKRFFRSCLFALCIVLWCAPVRAHRVYLANENHTDYGWNATPAEYDDSMLTELDYYLGRIGTTAMDPDDEQTRFAADCWYYLYLYEQNRSAAEFQQLIDAIVSRHITVPLNPLVTLYGGLPTEAAIRSGYYPGRIERQHGIPFSLGEDMENQTNPWGLASLWAGSQVKYSWKGICACATNAPYQDHTTDVFRWRGPDGKELLMKWYELSDSPMAGTGGGDDQSFGGYSEARNNLSIAGIQKAIDRDSGRGLPLSGMFGYGWDNVTSTIDTFESTVSAWNTANPGDPARVSNIIDYFTDLEQRIQDGDIDPPVLQGGWGNDWDLWPATLAHQTSLMRRAVEELRTAEALAAVLHGLGNTTFWPPWRDTLEAAWIDYYKYFEHGWTNFNDVLFSAMVANKKGWQQSFTATVQQLDAAAEEAFAALFQTPDEDRFVVFNPLGFQRTDYAELAVSNPGPFVVTDLATSNEVPSQVLTIGGGTFLRILATDVPSLGYRVYSYTAGSPAASDCCSVDTVQQQIENGRYQVTLGSAGEITSLIDKANGNRELAGPADLNDFGSGNATAFTAENVGAVSATLSVEVSGTPPRRVRVSLFRDLDRIEIENEITANYTATGLYDFAFNLTAPQIRFEEVGAIARPGLKASQGGDFLPGTRPRYMTLNHFVDLDDGNYQVTLSSRDAYAMRLGNSTDTTFDLPTSLIHVLALGDVSSGQTITDQGGESSFRDDLALWGNSGTFSGAAAKRRGLAHQNPLRAIGLARQQAGVLTAPTASFLSVTPSSVVLTAFKPVEEGDRGLLVRLWEMDGAATTATVDAASFSPSTAARTSLIETDLSALPVSAGQISSPVDANEIVALRLALGGIPTSTPTNTGTPMPATATPTPTRTPTRSPTATPSSTSTSSPTTTPTQSPTFTRTATASPTVTPTNTPSPTPTQTPTSTRTPTQSPTATPSSTSTNSPTTTPTQSPTSTRTPTQSPTTTPTLTSTSTPSTTPTLASATIQGLVTLQGRAAPPDPSWSVPLTLSLTVDGQQMSAFDATPTTDENGQFTASGIPPNDYAAAVKSTHTLSNKRAVTLAAGANVVDFGTLREGDADDDDCVVLLDFSILATGFAHCLGEASYDGRADFNEDDCVTLPDFSLLSNDFTQCGDLFSETTDGTPQATAPPGVTLHLASSTVKPRVGDVFRVDVRAQAAQRTDAVAAYLDFDPEVLQVAEVVSAGPFSMVIQNKFDNARGFVDFAAGSVSDFPSGEFGLMKITLHAIAPSKGTQLVFSDRLPRRSDATLGGRSVFVSAGDGEIVVSTQCVGDCDNNGAVTIDELVSGINIGLGAAPVRECPSLDRDEDGKVAIDEMVSAVDDSLRRCSSIPKSTKHVER